MRLLPLLLVAGCAVPTVVDRQPGLDGGWKGEETRLDVTGTTATLVFKGRVLIFEDVSWFQGWIGEDEVVLAGERLRIRADKERILIASGKTSVERPLESLPAGSRFAWRDGELKPR